MSRNWLLILIGSSWTAKPLGQGGHFWMCNMITTRMMAAWCKSSWSEALKWSPNWKSLLSTQSRCCLLLCCSCTCQNCEKRFFWSQNNMLTGIWSLICRYLQQNELYDNCKMCVRSQINTWFAPKQYIVYALFCQRKTTNQAMSASNSWIVGLQSKSPSLAKKEGGVTRLRNLQATMVFQTQDSNTYILMGFMKGFLSFPVCFPLFSSSIKL